MLQIPQPGQPQQRVRVKVLRPFMLKGERVEVDSVLTVDAMLALELKGSNKAEETDEKEYRAKPKPAQEPEKAVA
jgi:hypothetical protein